MSPVCDQSPSTLRNEPANSRYVHLTKGNKISTLTPRTPPSSHRPPGVRATVPQLGGHPNYIRSLLIIHSVSAVDPRRLCKLNQFTLGWLVATSHPNACNLTSKCPATTTSSHLPQIPQSPSLIVRWYARTYVHHYYTGAITRCNRK